MSSPYLCVVCLADPDTELLPLGEFAKLYELLAGVNVFTQNYDLYTCVLCCEFFAQIKEFKDKIHSAQEVLLDFINDPKEKDVTNESINEDIPELPDVKMDLDDFINNDEPCTADNDCTNNEDSTNKNNCFGKHEPLINKVGCIKSYEDDHIKKDKSIMKVDESISKDGVKENDCTDEDEKKIDADFEPPSDSQNSGSDESNKPNEKIKKPNLKEKYNYARVNYTRGEEWTDSDIDLYIKKEDLPFTREYFRQLLDESSKRVEFKSVPGEQLLKNDFDMYVEMQVCEDEDEIKVLMSKSRAKKTYKARKHRCNSCVLAFRTRAVLVKHTRDVHSRQKALSHCHLCRMGVPKEALEAHVRTHYTKYVCKLCGHTECNTQQMSDHFRSKKMIKMCVECNAVLMSNEAFNEHVYQSHQKFVCDQCQIEFRDRLRLELHKVNRHISYTCKVCHIQLPCRAKRKKHDSECRRPAGEPNPEPRWYCVECDKHYTTKGKWYTHVNYHKEMGSFTCDQCGKTYANRYNLKSHIYSVHTHDRAQCQLCFKFYANERHLKVHIQIVHEKKKPPKTKECHICHRKFQTRRILTNHIRTHTGEKPHQCPHCDAAFVQKVAMTTHVKRHHDDRGSEIEGNKKKKREK